MRVLLDYLGEQKVDVTVFDQLSLKQERKKVIKKVKYTIVACRRKYHMEG